MSTNSLSRGYHRGRDHIRQLNAERKPAAPLVKFTAEQIAALAKVFCDRLGRPRANDLELAGFQIADLLLRGLITREPGRYSIGYQPGEAVVAEMWKQQPTLCSVLRLPVHGGAA